MKQERISLKRLRISPKMMLSMKSQIPALLSLTACCMTALVALSATNVIDARADYSVPFSTEWSAYLSYWRSDLLTVPNDAIALHFTVLDTDGVWNWAKVGTEPNSVAGATDIQIIDNKLDLTTFAGQSVYVYCYYWTNRINTSIINDVQVAWEYAGNPPDNNNYATEQRYYSVNWGSSQFTKSNSLPLIYSVEHTLDEFTPEGQCNSIQVDASTVGGDALEWRLNLGQSGVDGQTAWLPIGYKMPVEVGSFDLHSVQLRMKDPSDPTQYYPLDPSELSLCTVTYGYTADVVLQLPHGEYQELPTVEMPTVGEYQLPTMPAVGEYISPPVSVFTTVFNWFTDLPHIGVLVAVVAFAFVVRVIIW